jgi:hypothetical protein
MGILRQAPRFKESLRTCLLVPLINKKATSAVLELEGVASDLDFSNVVGRIYDAAVEPRFWPDVLEMFCGLFRSAAGAITITTSSSGVRCLRPNLGPTRASRNCLSSVTRR